jgi:hypothetical protein
MLAVIRRSLGDEFADREAVTTAFCRHNQEVRATIASGRLLVMDIADGWEPLCGFLDVPVPAEPFPRVNERLPAELISIWVDAMEADDDRERHGTRPP